ncbi:MAG: branched-chain amino acid ABC transporter permease [Actinomycetota bacterium]
MPDCLGTELQFRIVGGLSTGSIYALIALGYTLVYGVLQLINFAHSEVFMSGVLGGMLFLNVFAGSDGTVPAILFVVAFLPAMVAAAAVAVTLERVAYRPLRRRGASRLSYLISAIGASFFLSNLALLWRGREFENYPQSIDPAPLFNLGRVPVQSADVVILIVMVVMMVGLDRFIQRTRTGKGIRAVAQDVETAGLMGVDINRMVTVTFIIGGMLAGAAGLLYGLKFGVMRFDIGFLPGIKAFTAAVLGGIGNIRGAMVGGMTLGLMESIGAGCFGNAWKDVIAFVLLVGVLMFRPTGLLGEGVGQKA